jgi:hypothetical protein
LDPPLTVYLSIKQRRLTLGGLDGSNIPFRKDVRRYGKVYFSLGIPRSFTRCLVLFVRLVLTVLTVGTCSLVTVGKIEQAPRLLHLEFRGTMETFLLDESYELAQVLMSHSECERANDVG